MKKVHLTREQRYTICAMNKQGCSQKMIVQAVGKDKSVICRELKRNANPKGRYVFEYAQDMAELRKERAKLPCGKNAKELTETVYRMLLPYKDSVHTITVDNGAEFADHQRLAGLLDSKIYFTHPYSSWEKGLIEYTNKLFRQYIPKKSNLDDFNDQQIKQIQYRINDRPRYKLNFYSPKEMFFLNLNNKVAFNG